MSPTQRSLKLLRDRGWTACVVEKYNSFARVRQDAFGFGDILAFHPILGIMLVQTTTRTNLSTRKKKVVALRDACEWASAGGRILLHGWKGNEVKEITLWERS